ncbi:acyltransferase family protein [Mycolicibacterium novocastrense]|uniref:Acyltransferase domain-containing protein n=1 Tax=Mycolicibacterium novocastrense TaxID=59813 RepID=A0AAW5SS16_MYCNV|nr:lysophospholipid acyltransferase family protein [Mycolicibacterium novocastrense]MCV7025888.1 acyltransferase family protein [Mycolicibacterium novocastrense]GAT08364.1 acyltransferase domain-containing protein [Mycolicibacterium novocastrense]
MNASDVDGSELAKWDRDFTELATKLIAPVINRYFRVEVRGLESVPSSGGVLVVSNHSGGMLTPDVLVFAPAFYKRFGYDRPLYTLAHYGVFFTPLRSYLSRIGVVHANPENAAKALRSDAVVLVYPGGDYDAYRSTLSAHVIDFEGRTGYARLAIDTGVPIVPVVSIGGQETQLFLTRGDRLAKRLGLHRIRLDILPLTAGFPFGVTSFFPANMPLPAKIVDQVLEPIDVRMFGGNAQAVDAHVRSVMQTALDRLAQERRFPVLG